MPELPEVESIVRELNQADLIGGRWSGARIYWPRTVAAPDAPDLAAAVPGLGIERIARRGKFIVFELTQARRLLIHLRMSGRLSLDKGWPQCHAHARLALRLEDGRVLVFLDPRKFGRVWLLAHGEPSPLDALGVEPLSPALSVPFLTRRLAGRTAAIKTLLLNQTLIAGVGNIYADEALWEARIHPLAPGAALRPDAMRRLRRALRRVLRRALRADGTSLGTGKGNFYGLNGRPGRNQTNLKVYRRTRLPCPACARPIERIVVAQRSTHFCPHCQKR